jgi:chemotaxis response regulator CheB
VVLTGYLHEGTAGIHTVKSRGAIAIIQDPKAAVQPPCRKAPFVMSK